MAISSLSSLVSNLYAMIHCINCYHSYPDNGVPYRCPECGGTYDYRTFPTYNPAKVVSDQPGIWRYRHTFGLPSVAPLVTLGEGDTTLVWADVFERRVAFKLEYLNPTGSHKDRGVALMTSFLLSRGVEAAVEDSSGNAGASFAAYAARSGVKARIFIPDYAAGPKRHQINAYGADVVRILGPRSAVAEAVRRAAEVGAVYASHTYLPHLLPGFATIAYELVEQLGDVPGTVVSPVGHGSLLLGVARGFMNLQRAGVVDQLPRLVGVQSMACAPLWAVFTRGPAGLALVTEGETLAEGVRVSRPRWGDALLGVVEASQGSFLAVEEEMIIPGRDQLARRGFYVEPTSAIVWQALSQIVGNFPEPIIVLLTGLGYKSVI